MYSEKATKFCNIFPLLSTTIYKVKSQGKISQNFVAFFEYMNFIVSSKPTKNLKDFCAGKFMVGILGEMMTS